jgi:micrococcal nuclease
MISNIILAAAISVGPSAFMKPYDGDTLRLKLRLADIDTPEIKGDCQNESKLALVARDHSFHFITSYRVTITVVGKGYYGRPLVRVVRSDGLSLSDSLIKEGLAVPYVKGLKDNPWCQ